jgi:hypothetical protein
MEMMAQMTEGISSIKDGFEIIRSLVLDFMQTTKRTAIDSAGMNFSTKEKNFGVFLFAKIRKGRSRRISIIRPIANVTIRASREVSFILLGLLWGLGQRRGFL